MILLGFSNPPFLNCTFNRLNLKSSISQNQRLRSNMLDFYQTSLLIRRSSSHTSRRVDLASSRLFQGLASRSLREPKGAYQLCMWAQSDIEGASRAFSSNLATSYEIGDPRIMFGAAESQGKDSGF